MLRSCFITAVLLLAAPCAFAQSMSGMQMNTPSANAPASTRDYQAAMSKMDQGMSINYTGNADVDFVSGMIPHHQGAVDMAQIELKYGKDPQLRKLAQNIIASQTNEIAFMQAWQAKHAK